MARLLVVDDDDMVREMFKDIIEFLGHDVKTLNNGTSALDYITSGAEIDLLITDIVMPDMSGDKLVSAILKHGGTTNFPILIVSGEFWRRDLHSLLENNRIRFLQKPVGLRQLKHAIETSLKATKVSFKTHL